MNTDETDVHVLNVHLMTDKQKNLTFFPKKKMNKILCSFLRNNKRF